MDKLKVTLTNCFGIESLDYEFDFSDCRVFSVYARNGLMKTSFTKGFQLIQLGKAKDICDVIYDKEGSANITIDGKPITKDQVFAIRSFETGYESDVTSLLIKGEIKAKLQEVFSLRMNLLKEFEKLSGLKIEKISSGKKVYELEDAIISDFAFQEKSILLNLEKLAGYEPEIICGDVKYGTIFDPTAIKIIENPKFQDGIRNFIKATDQIYASYAFLEKGSLTFPKLKVLKKSLEENRFFVRNNRIYFSGSLEIPDLDTLDSQIIGIEEKVRQTPEYQAIESLLSTAKGILLKDLIETHPDLIEYLSLDRLPILKMSLWASYVQSNSTLVQTLLAKYEALSQEIDSVNLKDTQWQQALDIFKQRFFVPFDMNIVNFKGAIIGENIPQVEFVFSHKNDVEPKFVDRRRLEDMDVLSQGEKRALYLLNIIFDIEQVKATGKEVVLVLDDIADSFDYKNKYAIIEYLYELAHEEKFHLIAFTHNFDFHRTLTSRLDIKRGNCLVAEKKPDSILLVEEYYQNQPFKHWKGNPNEKNVLALIPFVRNLCEYGTDLNIAKKGKDFEFLTSLLHDKTDTGTITFFEIEPLFKQYIGIPGFLQDINKSSLVIDRLFAVCDQLSPQNANLEDKIVLAMAIRHKAERFMQQEIKAFTGPLVWKNRKTQCTCSCVDYLQYVEKSKNQTRKLFSGYDQFGNPEKKSILNRVNIMTPENIHINSFMYEPIMDMDIDELQGLYQCIKSL